MKYSVTQVSYPFLWEDINSLPLKLWRFNNLTHKRLREGCVDWKSIGCPQPHMSLSKRWHQHFFKRCNRFFSLQGLCSESTSGIQCLTTAYFSPNFENISETPQHHWSKICLSVTPIMKISSVSVENRGNKDTPVCLAMIQHWMSLTRI